MVDLVKIRKKAKKAVTPSKSEGPGREEGAQSVPEPESAAPYAQEPEPEPEPDIKPPAAHPPSSLADARDDKHEHSKLDRFKEEAGKKRQGLIQAEAVAESGEQF